MRFERVLTPGGWVSGASVGIDGGSISAISRDLVGDSRFHELWAVPGLWDVQINGGGGTMFSLDRSRDAYLDALRAHAAVGTTHVCPTIISGPLEEMEEAIALVADVAEDLPPDCASIAGIHVEGPFLAPVRKGGHAERYLIDPSVEVAQRLVAAGRGLVKIFSLAPELPGARSVVSLLAEAGIFVSAAHTDASDSEIDVAQSWGLGGVTHVFNGMDSLQNRAPGVAGAALASDLLMVGLIADLLHVSPTTCRVVLHAKPPGTLYLTTDAVSPLGTTGGSFDLYGVTVTVRDGGCYTSDGVLAGTATPLLKMVWNVAGLGVTDLASSLAMASSVPASVVSKDARSGHIVEGGEASFNIVTPGGDLVAQVLRGQLMDC